MNFRVPALRRHLGEFIVQIAEILLVEMYPLKNAKFPFFVEFFFLLGLLLLKAGILKNHGMHPVLLGKWAELPGFSISVQINVSSTINMQKKGSIKSSPCRGLLLSFYDILKLGVLAKWSLKLYFWSWSFQVVLGNFLFSELFNGEFFPPAFRIYLYFCQKHRPKSRKFNVLPNFTSGTGSLVVPWSAIYPVGSLSPLLTKLIFKMVLIPSVPKGNFETKHL